LDGTEFCEGQVLSIVNTPLCGNFLRVDMEVEFIRAHDRWGQAGPRRRHWHGDSGYLFRSESDIRDLLACGCRIRLCKGAYKEPPEVAFPRKEDVDGNYVELMRMLLPSGIYHGIATHDPKMIAATIRCAAELKISKSDFEFQMLYGVRTDLQRRLVRDGFRVRIYIPYGQDWFPYFMRRLAERPANLAFFARNFFR
jgi:proline dehydrogenase